MTNDYFGLKVLSNHFSIFQIQDHEMYCDYATVPCAYHKYGCTHKVWINLWIL